MHRTTQHGSNRLATQPSLLSTILLALLFAIAFASSARACPGNTPDNTPEKIIGIHLGRTESRVAGVKDGRIVVFSQVEGGSRYESETAGIRSVVKLTQTGLVAGEEARSARGPDLFRAVLGISEHFSTSEDGGSSRKQPPPGIEYILNNNNPEIQVTINATNHTIPTSDIYATLLTSLRSIAEASIGPDITGAVITLPRGASDLDRSYIEHAGDLIGLPIFRKQNETTSTLLALGIDEESYERDRYALIFDLDMDVGEMSLVLVEVDTGVMDTIAVHSVAGIGGDLGDEGFVDMMVQNLGLGSDAGDEDILTVAEALGSVGDLVNADLAISARKGIDELLRTAHFAPNEITDLIFTGDSSFYPEMQDAVEAYLAEHQVQPQSADSDGASNNSERQINVVNSMTLSDAPIWGAALTAYSMMEDPWVPCCCSTRRPPIGVSVRGGDVVEVIPGCQDVPILLSKVIEGRCSETGETAIQVVMRDVPIVDYHALFEFGEEYASVENETISDTILAEFNLPTGCEGDTSVTIEIEMFLSRQMELLVKAADRKSNESRLLTIPYLNSECGAKDRDAPREYTLQIGSGVHGFLEARYQRDLRAFVGGGNGQKVVRARRDEAVSGRCRLISRSLSISV
ncbi:Hsp70 protein-domain-containing protein [Aspergillus carlsbadensis]|nr:Hsp70 protein-domain-containing protein [Aspergillus carlsbadensis]